MTSSIPNPRQFLTSLIDNLTSIPPPTAVTTSTSSTSSASARASNPLKLIPPSCRPLLTTLYALYPLTLLPALDLLDRRLVTRVIVTPPPHSQQNTLTQDPSKGAPGKGQQTPDAKPSVFYLVRSVQPTHPRRHHRHDSASSRPGISYVVRTQSWNCSCAAFAFAAFPREESQSQSQPQQQQQHGYTINPPFPPLFPTDRDAEEEDHLFENGGGDGWEFGALSLDGIEGSDIAGVPCCKHLLACVLAERWSGVLGVYVDERIVGREEAAGLVADI